MNLADVMRDSECTICLQPLISDESLTTSQSSDRCDTMSQMQPRGVYRGITIELEANVYSGMSLNAQIDILQHSLQRHGENLSKRSRKGKKDPRNSDNKQIAVLPCGHLFHHLCAVQHYEFQSGALCPICRHPVNSLADIVIFHPRNRKKFVEGKNLGPVTSSTAPTAVVDSVDEAADDDVCITGERHCLPVEAYSARLGREVADLERRRAAVQSREARISTNRDNLENRCLLLESSVMEAQRRFRVLTRGETLDVKRLLELRVVGRQTHELLKKLTEDLASATRAVRQVEGRILHCTEKLQQFTGAQSDRRTGDYHGIPAKRRRSGGEAVTVVEDSHQPLKREQLTDL
uniref:RING-type domain-containing protein n=1 Tax=Trypanosoma congolense (strain IL3000) TaxID=1068625 RepID=G0UPD0_TRYCI|nr:conserved hypothetical protein [Trypanosoma congolense IL3000]